MTAIVRPFGEQVREEMHAVLSSDLKNSSIFEMLASKGHYVKTKYDLLVALYVVNV